MIGKESIAVMAATSGASIVQTFILREYVDKVHGPIPGLEALNGFGTYSALGGIISGGAATALGLASVLTGKITRNETIQLGLIGYGIPALSGGILSGLFPVPAAAGAGLRGRSITLRSAGAQRAAAAQRASGVAPSQTSAIPLRR